MQEKKRNSLAVLLGYAGNYKWFTFTGMGISAVSMVMSMMPFVCVWLIVRDLIAVAPQWTEATHIADYAWMAFYFAVGSIVLYFAALMLTHLAAFRTASNIRKQGMAHLMKAPLGFFNTHASGFLRNRLDGAVADTETLLAHNLADIVGTVAMFITTIVLLFVFDWRMGAACMLAAVISVSALYYMMGGKNAKAMEEYQVAQDYISKVGTEYVRGIPIVKVFQQTVYSFKAFKEAIDKYSDKAMYYQDKICRKPQSLNLTFTEGAFVFLVPVALILAPAALKSGGYKVFLTDFGFYAVFSAIISTALAKIMFAAAGIMRADIALSRIDTIMSAPQLKVCSTPEVPADNKVEFENVSFSYEGSELPALEQVSFTVLPGQTVALVGPSGCGKTTAASLIPRFWDVSSGSVKVGGVDVSRIDPHVLMDRIAFVFQDNHLFKASVLDNVRVVRPDASLDEVRAALEAAQCKDIVAKLPEGIETVIGSGGAHLSGGELQRIALARAILKDAPIVILDEATAFADPENEVLIQKAFVSLTRNKTVIMIAHRLSTVVNADKIIVLDEGKIVEEGSHKELLSGNGLYARMWADYRQGVQWRISTEK
ncbi:MAG: ABC transporter ATP-binding protein/permease [Bacteroidales bacterium]|nr:ABC transporter ATP-binding protein/permease [Bacteroidales bacterium]